jgi:hypothetical protein
VVRILLPLGDVRVSAWLWKGAGMHGGGSRRLSAVLVPADGEAFGWWVDRSAWFHRS